MNNGDILSHTTTYNGHILTRQEATLLQLYNTAHDMHAHGKQTRNHPLCGQAIALLACRQHIPYRCPACIPTPCAQHLRLPAYSFGSQKHSRRHTTHQQHGILQSIGYRDAPIGSRTSTLQKDMNIPSHMDALLDTHHMIRTLAALADAIWVPQLGRMHTSTVRVTAVLAV
jgi:hypothetical protein